MAKDKAAEDKDGKKKVKPPKGSRPGMLDRLTTLVMLAFVVAQLYGKL
jgi:hypothetical protein